MKVYLASGLGFSELGKNSINYLKENLKELVRVIEPFESNSDLGLRIQEIEKDQSTSLFIIKSELKEINYQIGKRNENLINEADLILAILDGNDLDSGTSAEIGYAYGIGKKIIGYRGDFRNTGDNIGSVINLQVEYFVLSSGGYIFSSIKELVDYLKKIQIH